MTRLNWGMVGGGDGSQIGPAHRLGAGLNGAFSFVAGALDHNPEAGRAFAQSLGIPVFFIEVLLSLLLVTKI